MQSRYLRRTVLSLRSQCNARSFSSGISQNNVFKGVWPIIATPFNSDETINYKSFDKIIDFFNNQIQVNGCTIIGVLGESNRLNDNERSELIKIACKTSIGKPICVGTTHSGTHAAIKLSEQALSYGAHSIMVTPSLEPVPDQTNIINYYKSIHAALGEDVPIVLQDHPASTRVHMTMDTIKHIISECPSVDTVKLESLPSPPKMRILRKWIDDTNHNVSILGGLGGLYGMFDLESGCNGFMTGFAFPEVLQALNRECENGNIEKARMIYQKYLPLMVFEQQPGIAIRKEIYKLRGIMDCTHVRSPGKNANDESKKQLKEWIEFVIGSDIDITKPLHVDIEQVHKSF